MFTNNGASIDYNMKNPHKYLIKPSNIYIANLK